MSRFIEIQGEMQMARALQNIRYQQSSRARTEAFYEQANAEFASAKGRTNSKRWGGAISRARSLEEAIMGLIESGMSQGQAVAYASQNKALQRRFGGAQ